MAFPEVIDNTIRKAFAVCPTKAKYEFVENLTPLGAKSIHLVFGAAFAVGLEVTRKMFFERSEGGAAPLPSTEALEEGIQHALAYFGDADCEGTYKTVDRLEGALRYYFKTWPLDSELIVPVEGGIECTFSFPLPIMHPDTGKPIMYGGRYDMLGVHKQYPHQLWVVDEKTASRLGELWDAKWDLDCQLTGYICSVRKQILSGERQCSSITADGLDIRAMVRAVSILKDSFGHTEVPMVRSAWYIDRWYGQLCRDVQRMVDSYKKGTWDLALHEHACVQFGRKCDFNPLCLTPHPDRIKEGLYGKRDWNPLVRGDD